MVGDRWASLRIEPSLSAGSAVSTDQFPQPLGDASGRLRFAILMRVLEGSVSNQIRYCQIKPARGVGSVTSVPWFQAVMFVRQRPAPVVLSGPVRVYSSKGMAPGLTPTLSRLLGCPGRLEN